MRASPSSAAASEARGRELARVACTLCCTHVSPLAAADAAPVVANLPLYHAQGLTPLLWRRVRGTLLAASPLGEELALAAQRNRIAALVQQDALAQVVGLLQDHGVAPVLLKGLAVARQYPEPDLRPVGDLDLWVRPADVPPTRAAFEAAGYRDATPLTDRHLNVHTFVGPGECPVDVVEELHGVPVTLAS